MKLLLLEVTDPSGTPVSREGLSPDRVQKQVLRILKTQVLCSIATVDQDSQAYINTAYFCYSDELELYFLSHPKSQHCQNLEANPSIAMTIFSSAQKWGEPDQGVQLFGTCALPKGVQASKASELYGKRFPDYRRRKQKLGGDDMVKAYRLYRFLVTKLKVFDEKNLGEARFIQASVKRESASQAAKTLRNRRKG